MKKTLTILIIVFFATDALYAQHAHFTTSGTIEYNRNMNMFALLKKRINKDNESYMQNMYEQYIRSNPQFRTVKRTPSLSKNKTLFVPADPDNARVPSFGDDPLVNQPNIIYANYDTRMETAQKSVFEEPFLLKDTGRKFKWKITDET